MLAAAPGDRLGSRYLDLLRCEFGPLVRAVAKGLRFRTAACTPPVGACGGG